MHLWVELGISLPSSLLYLWISSSFSVSPFFYLSLLVVPSPFPPISTPQSCSWTLAICLEPLIPEIFLFSLLLRHKNSASNSTSISHTPCFCLHLWAGSSSSSSLCICFSSLFLIFYGYFIFDLFLAPPLPCSHVPLPLPPLVCSFALVFSHPRYFTVVGGWYNNVVVARLKHKKEHRRMRH